MPSCVDGKLKVIREYWSNDVGFMDYILPFFHRLVVFLTWRSLWRGLAKQHKSRNAKEIGVTAKFFSDSIHHPIILVLFRREQSNVRTLSKANETANELQKGETCRWRESSATQQRYLPIRQAHHSSPIRRLRPNSRQLLTGAHYFPSRAIGRQQPSCS